MFSHRVNNKFQNVNNNNILNNFFISNRGFLSIYQMYRNVVRLKLYFTQKGKPNWTSL